MEKIPEFYKIKEEHRKETRQNLPSDLQLKYPQKQKKKLNIPSSELLEIRSSYDPEDKFFIETLRLEIKEKLGKEITEEEKEKLEELRKLQKEEKNKLKETLGFAIKIEKELKKYEESRRWDLYISSLEKAMTIGIIQDPSLYREAIEKGLKDYEKLNSLGFYIPFSFLEKAITIGIIQDPSFYRENVQKELEKYEESKQWHDYISLLKKAVDIGIIQDPSFYRENIEKELKEYEKLGQWDHYCLLLASAVSIGIIKDRQIIEKELERYEKLKEWYFYGLLLEAAMSIGIIKDCQTIEKGLEKYEKLYLNYEYVLFLEKAMSLGIIKDHQIIEKGLKKYEEMKLWDNYISFLEKAVAIGIIKNPSFYHETIEKGLKEYEESKKWDNYISFLEKAVAIGIIQDPSFYHETIEKGLKKYEESEQWDDYGSLLKKAIKAGIIPPVSEKVSSFRKILLTNHNIKEDEIIFSYACIINKLERNEDLGLVILEDLSAFRSLKEYSKTINSQLPEDKQSPDLNRFWEDNQQMVAKLFNIHRGLSVELIRSQMANFGFPRLERTLSLFNSLNNEAINFLYNFLQKTKRINFGDFEKIIELSDGFNRMGLDNIFKEKILRYSQNQKIYSSKEIIQDLSKTLLKEFAKKLSITIEIGEDAISLWNLEYLSKLFFAEKSFEQESRSILKLVVKATLQNDFQNIIAGKINKSLYNPEELELIEEIIKNNEFVKTSFEQAGLDYNQWLHYSKRTEFRVGVPEEEIKERISSFQREIYEIIVNILGSYREKRKGILSEEKAKALFRQVFGKYGIIFKNQELISPKGKLSLLDIEGPLREFAAFLEKESEEQLNDALKTNLDHLKNILKIFPHLQKESRQKGYHFQIKLWDRQPGYDIFQGNYTHCCIAVENFNRAAILDYLLDTGMNIVEIKDQNTNQTIAQTLIFMTQDEKGENILVLDNIEINNDYRGLTQEIRKHLFDYVAQFANDIIKEKSKKIDTVLLGTAYNDVETADLNKKRFTLKKTGSQPNNNQYLDSFGPAWVDPSQFTNKIFHIVLDNSKENNKEKPIQKQEKINKAEVLKEITPEILKEIEEVENDSFPEQIQSSIKDIEETLENPKGVHIIIRSEEGKIIGYISSKPQSEAFEELKSYDPQIQNEEDALYVEHIAIKPENRSLKTLLEAAKKFIEEAKNKKYQKITMHARIANNLSFVLQKRWGAKSLRKIDNWHNFGEPFEYLEIKI